MWRCSAIRNRYLFLVTAAGSLVFSADGLAVTTNWIDNGGGSFAEASNWDNGVPDSDDTAIFNRGFLAYTVTFPGSIFEPQPNYVIDYLRVHTNEVTFAPSSLPIYNGPRGLTVANPDVSIVIGENAGDVAIVNMTLSSLSVTTTSIGRAAGATGTLNVGGTFSMSGSLDVGDSGDGLLTIQNGGSVSSTYGRIGKELGSYGMVTVTGSGSSWTNASFLVVGDVGTGDMMIADGGSVSDNEGYIAFDSASPNTIGSVTVTGSGSAWINDQILSIGDGSRGFLRIEYGGAVSSGTAYVGANPAGREGSVTVTDPGSTWTNSGDLTVGSGEVDAFNPSYDYLIVAYEGEVSVGGILFVERSGIVAGNSTLSADIVNWGRVSPGLQPGVLTNATLGALRIDGSYLQATTARLGIRLGGITPEIQYDQLQVNGSVTLNGSLLVELADSFVPSAGDAFDILDWTSVSGTFDLVILPALSAGLIWNTSQLYVTGVLSVGLVGDYNGDGAVDAADYVVWRKNPGAFGGDPGGYNAWRANFGRTAAGGAGSTDANSAVPEPDCIVLACLIMAALLASRRSSSR